MPLSATTYGFAYMIMDRVDHHRIQIQPFKLTDLVAGFFPPDGVRNVQDRGKIGTGFDRFELSVDGSSAVPD